MMKQRLLQGKVCITATLLFGNGAAADMTSAQRSFTDALTSDLYQKPNECTSSLGVSMAFSLIYPASVGDSLTQMRNVFGYGMANSDPLVWKQTTSALVATYQGDCLYAQEKNAGAECARGQNPLVRIANSVWVRESIKLEKTYKNAVGDMLKPLDSGNQINDWVKERTNGLIDEIVPEELPSSWVLAAINAIYLKASWSKPFLEAVTTQDAFYTSSLRNKKTDLPARFMHQANNFDYYETRSHQILRLPFAGDREETNGLSMVFVLPRKGRRDTITTSRLWTQMSSLKRTRVAVAIPQFKFKSTYEASLMEALKKNGLEAPFKGGLCIEEGDEDCINSVDYAIQETFISVDEKGVEAAAVTVLGIDRSSPPSEKMFLCDHPFQFFIYDSKQDLFLFEGRVGNPGVPEGAPRADKLLLQASHKDDEFWRKYLRYDHFVAEPTMVSLKMLDANSAASRSSLTHLAALLLLFVIVVMGLAV